MKARLGTLAMGFVSLAATLISVVLLKYFKRKTIFYQSEFIMTT